MQAVRDRYDNRNKTWAQLHATTLRQQEALRVPTPEADIPFNLLATSDVMIQEVTDATFLIEGLAFLRLEDIKEEINIAVYL